MKTDIILSNFESRLEKRLSKSLTLRRKASKSAWLARGVRLLLDFFPESPFFTDSETTEKLSSSPECSVSSVKQALAIIETMPQIIK